GVRDADRDCGRLLRYAGARLLARAGPPHDQRRGALDLLRDLRGRTVRSAVSEARHLMRTILEVHGIVTRFGAQTVHDGLDMQVYEGEVFGIIGGSGSGKSVLLRTILGLRQP